MQGIHGRRVCLVQTIFEGYLKKLIKHRNVVNGNSMSPIAGFSKKLRPKNGWNYFQFQLIKIVKLSMRWCMRMIYLISLKSTINHQ